MTIQRDSPLPERVPFTRVIFIGLIISSLANSKATSHGEEPVDARLKAVERERDELRKRTELLESQVKRLQDTIDKLAPPKSVSPAEPPKPAPFEPGRQPPASSVKPGVIAQQPSSRPYWELDRPAPPEETIPPGARDARLSPVPAIGYAMPPEIVGIAVAFSDAVSEREGAKPDLEAVQQQVKLGAANSRDAVLATNRLQKAERKLRLLRKIITAMRDHLNEEAERIRRLAQIGGVPAAVLRDREARLKLLDLILSEDPEPAKPANPSTTK